MLAALVQCAPHRLRQQQACTGALPHALFDPVLSVSIEQLIAQSMPGSGPSPIPDRFRSWDQYTACLRDQALAEFRLLVGQALRSLLPHGGADLRRYRTLATTSSAFLDLYDPNGFFGDR